LLIVEPWNTCVPLSMRTVPNLFRRELVVTTVPTAFFHFICTNHDQNQMNNAWIALPWDFWLSWTPKVLPWEPWQVCCPNATVPWTVTHMINWFFQREKTPKMFSSWKQNHRCDSQEQWTMHGNSTFWSGDFVL
jgi:hypothetical protein